MTKIALVTGGTRGIGESISKKLKNDNYTVIANYAGNDDAAKKFSKENDIVTMKWDVSDYNSCKKNVEKIFKVEVVKVNILNKRTKIKSTRGRKVKVSGFKKAIVTLKKGQNIDLTTGI